MRLYWKHRRVSKAFQKAAMGESSQDAIALLMRDAITNLDVRDNDIGSPGVERLAELAASS